MSRKRKTVPAEVVNNVVETIAAVFSGTFSENGNGHEDAITNEMENSPESGNNFATPEPKPDAVVPTSCTRYLEHVFTEAELAEMGKKLARLRREIKAKEEEKKQVDARIGAEIKELTGEVDSLVNLFSDEMELREIECSITYHMPEVGKKTLVRHDTAEEMVEAMEEREWNLFNQPSEEKTESAEEKLIEAEA